MKKKLITDLLNTKRLMPDGSVIFAHTKTDVAKMTNSSVKTVSKVSKRTPNEDSQTMRAKISLSQKGKDKIRPEILEEIIRANNIFIGYTRGLEEYTRRMSINEIVEYLKRKGINTNKSTVSRVIAKIRLKTENKLISSTAKKKHVNTKRDIELVRRMLSDVNRTLSFEGILRVIQKIGDSSVTIGDIREIAKKMSLNGTYKGIKSEVRLNNFTREDIERLMIKYDYIVKNIARKFKIVGNLVQDNEQIIREFILKRIRYYDSDRSNIELFFSKMARYAMLSYIKEIRKSIIYTTSLEDINI